ncbi:MAG: hypothetical protein ACOY0T_31860 [Myxococcota bacterium]
MNPFPSRWAECAFACALGFAALACGKAESSSQGMGGSVGLGGQANSGGVTNGSGGAPMAGAGSGGKASSVPPAARGDCILYPDFVRSYAAEVMAAGGASSGGPGSGEPDPEALGPCGQCITKCSRAAVPGCENHTDCVTRHCSCEGCENRLRDGDFCACVESCNAPGDEACLAAWVDYAVCVSKACADTCPGM